MLVQLNQLNVFSKYICSPIYRHEIIPWNRGIPWFCRKCDSYQSKFSLFYMGVKTGQKPKTN